MELEYYNIPHNSYTSCCFAMKTHNDITKGRLFQHKNNLSRISSGGCEWKRFLH